MSPRSFAILRWSIIALGSAGIFILPWAFPPSRPTDSLSYVYGFNNQVAWIAALGGIAALSLLEIVRRKHLPANPVAECLSEILTPPVASNRDTNLRKAFLVATGLSVAAAGVWYLILPTSDYGEMSYFVSRLELMILGQQPYSNFDFFYGPLLIYPQYWLYLLGSGRISIEQSYAVILLLEVAAGITGLYLVFKKIGGKADLAIPLLVVAGSSFIAMFAMGLNYTFLRFIGPLFTLLSLHSYGKDRPLWFRFLLAGGLTLLNFFVSPEMGLAACVAVSFYLVLRRDLYPILGVLGAFALTAFVLGFYYFEYAISAGEGAADFPIFPTIHVLLYLAALALILPHLAANEWYSLGKHTGLAGGLFVLASATIPAALGRCDAGHILYNGATILILALCLAANSSIVSYRRSSYGLFAFAFLFIGAICFWMHFHDGVILALKNRLAFIKKGESYWTQPGVIVIRNRQLLLSKPAPRFWEDLNDLKKYDSLGTPLSYEMEIDHFLKLSDRYASSYRSNPIEILNRNGLAKQIESIKTMQNILVPEHYFEGLQPPNEQEYNAANSRALSKLFFFPVSFKKWKHPPFVARDELMDFVREHFEERERWRHYVVMTRKGLEGDETSDSSVSD